MPDDRVLIPGGTVLTLDRELGVFERARAVPATADAATGGGWMPHHF